MFDNGQSTDLPWNSAKAASTIAMFKLSRILPVRTADIDNFLFILSAQNLRYMAEELRESADYLERAADLLPKERVE